MDVAFQNRVLTQMYITAQAVDAEGAVSNHAQRLTVVNKWVLIPSQYTSQIAAFCAANVPTLVTTYLGNVPNPGPDSRNCTDTDIATGVNLAVNIFAGV